MGFPGHNERFRYRVLRQLKNLLWFGDYLLWLLFSSYKFKKFPNDIRSVLVVEDIGIGDILVATPVFRALKKKYASLTVLVKPGMQDVLRGNPYVDSVITDVDKDYDLGVILHARTNGNWNISKMLRKHCRFRIGCTRVGLREGSGFFLHRKTIPTFAIKKKELDNRDVIRTIGLDGDSYLEAYTDFVPLIKEYVVFHTHGAYLTHNWYPEKWVELAKQSPYKTIVFTGTDRAYVQGIISQLVDKNCIDATGTNIQEYFGWIKHADVVVTVDTSAMHVAAAFNRPVISLFGAGDPRIWRPEPVSAKSDVILKGDCHSCHKNFCALGDHRCMQLIDPKDILEKL